MEQHYSPRKDSFNFDSLNFLNKKFGVKKIWVRREFNFSKDEIFDFIQFNLFQEIRIECSLDNYYDFKQTFGPFNVTKLGIVVHSLGELLRLKKIEFDADIIVRPKEWFSARALDVATKELDRSRIFFHFEPFDIEKNSAWRVSDINLLITDLKKMNIFDLVKTFRFVDFLDENIEANVKLDPIASVQLQTRECQKPRVSVVIPTYNNCSYLRLCLRALSQQSLDPSKYEIIIVDDGSDEQTQGQIKKLMFELSRVSIKYIYFPRPPGTVLRRAGVARNVGVGHSLADTILFLDADILLDSKTIEKMWEQSQRWDVVQCKRAHVANPDLLLFQDLNEAFLKAKFFYKQNDYIEPFYEASAWQDLKDYWKYTCSYCLMLKKKDFIEAGMFNRGFVSYGFEDVNLGYKLYGAGKTFCLLDKTVIHVEAEGFVYNDEIESKRQEMLANTAKIFYLQHLNDDIYQLFNVYMSGKLRPAPLLKGYNLAEDYMATV